MKLFSPKKSFVGGRSGLKAPRLSSHLVRPAKFAFSKISIKAPRVGRSGRGGKIKL